MRDFISLLQEYLSNKFNRKGKILFKKRYGFSRKKKKKEKKQRK